MMFSLLNLLLLLCVTSMAFSFSSIRPSFNHNRFSTVLLAKPSVNSESTNNIEKDQPQLKKGINLSNLLQLVLMGAGAPSLGEFDRMDENGKMFFKLEANNFVDSKGESLQAKAKYFTDGYVESRDDVTPPGFWQNLASGGRLQTEWEEQMKQQQQEK